MLSVLSGRSLITSFGSPPPPPQAAKVEVSSTRVRVLIDFMVSTQF